MKKRLILTLLSSVWLAACNKADTPQDQPTNQNTSAAVQSSAPAAPVSSLPANAPTYKMAVDPTYPPFALKDEKGQAIGFDIDILTAIGEKQGFKVELVPRDWDGILEELPNKKYQIVGSGLGNADELRQKYSISKPIILSNTIILSNATNPINALEDMKGKKIGVLSSGSSDWTLKNAQKFVNQPNDVV